MMKKFCIGLTVLLLLLVGPAALAAEDIGSDLARITQSVKTTLSIGDEYTDFYGNQNQSGLATNWDLYWSNDTARLNVTADAKGRILSYYYDSGNWYGYRNDYAPIFPKQGREEAVKVARSFLSRVLANNEEMIFQSEENMPKSLQNESRYYFYGSLKINGVPSLLYCHVEVNDSLQVVSFSRENMDWNYLGGIPAGVPKIAAKAAGDTLATIIGMEPAYYLQAQEEGTVARLQYRPQVQRPSSKATHDRYFYDARSAFYVDAQTGKLIDMEELYRLAEDSVLEFGLSGGKGSAANEAAPAAMAMAMDGGVERSLSDAEQEGVAKVEGLLTKAQLDAKLRAMGELALDKAYVFSSINYSKSWDGDGYQAVLSYYRESTALSLGLSESALKKLKDEGGKYYTYKTFTLDAKSGELRQFYTNRPYISEALISRAKQDGQPKAEAFLGKYFPDHFAQTALENERAGYKSENLLFYARQHNGYSFPENSLRVVVNPFSGEIEEFNLFWDEEIEFAPVDEIISAQQAKELYLSTLECRLAYRPLPLAIDPSRQDIQPYLRMGSLYLYQMTLVYAYEISEGKEAFAVDALSGELHYYENYSRQIYSYDDIEGHAAQSQITELAAYGVGFSGGKFLPAAKLTEQDMLLFLLSAYGYAYEAGDLSPEKLDSLYQEAIYRGIFERDHQKNPGREISRGELVKSIVIMGGYGKTAAIPGIFKCNFADEAGISPELKGYVAIAQGLAMVKGGGNVSFKAGEIVNRGEMAIIFYNFMDRKY